jgi:hypothetical protein
MRAIFGQCPKDQVPFLQLCGAKPWSAPLGSYASRRTEWVQPQFGSPQCRAA